MGENVGAPQTLTDVGTTEEPVGRGIGGLTLTARPLVLYRWVGLEEGHQFTPSRLQVYNSTMGLQLLAILHAISAPGLCSGTPLCHLSSWV